MGFGEFSILNKNSNNAIAVPSDPDAESFFSVAGITDTAIKSAVTNLCIRLKSNNLYAKFYDLYPFAGGNSTAHSFNLINPTLYKLTYPVAPTHGSNGMNCNGSTQYAKTGFIPSSVLSLNNTAVHFYSRTDQAASNGVCIGSLVSASQQIKIQQRNAGNFFGASYDATSASSAVADSVGLFSIVRSGGTLNIYKNGNLIATQSGASGTLPNVELYLGAFNSAGSPANFRNTQCAFSGVSSAMTAAEVVTLNSIIELYQYEMSRTPINGFNIVYEGDSFFSSDVDIATLIDSALTAGGYSYASTHNAVSGSAISYPRSGLNWMTYSGRYNAVSALYNSTFYKNILAGWEITNDLYFYLNDGSYSVSQAIQNVYSGCTYYYGSFGAIGYKCILNTVTPRGDSAAVNLGYETARQNSGYKNDTSTINGQLRSDFNVTTSYARIFKSNLSKWSNCYLVDVGDDPIMGQINQCNNLTYFRSDKIHPNSTGASLIQAYYNNAITLIKNGL